VPFSLLASLSCFVLTFLPLSRGDVIRAANLQHDEPITMKILFHPRSSIHYGPHRLWLTSRPVALRTSNFRWASTKPKLEGRQATVTSANGPVTRTSPGIDSRVSRQSIIPTSRPRPEASDYVIIPGDSQRYALPDGRKLGYSVVGSRSRTAQKIVAEHGTPGSRLDYCGSDSWARKKDIMMICPERPGYGLSTLKKNYSPLDHARDVRFFIDDLGHRKYKVMASVV
jgi:hypothetical protein